jgi:catechol 2,3-dioxygenase-like lactoylglutathione lyase family enzyme
MKRNFRKVLIERLEGNPVYEETIPNSMRHIALEVANFEEAIHDLMAKRIEIVEGPGERPDGSDYLFCKDPDGNCVEITRH